LCFEGNYCLQPQDRRIREIKQKETVADFLSDFFKILKMEAANYSETSVNIYETTRRHISKRIYSLKSQS
jgi:hypothetical protein